MELTCIASSSKGNAYVIQNPEEALIIEAGAPMQDVMSTLGFNVSKVAGCLVTHEHLDHAKNVSKVQEYGIKCFMSKGTADKCRGLRYVPEIIEAGKQFSVGRFEIMPFSARHSASDPLGFLLHHPDMGYALFAIDTCYLPYTFEGLNNIMIECNYSDDILQRNIEIGIVHPVVQKHVLTGHMSLQTCIQALKSNDLIRVNNIILMHLSSENSDAERFKNEVSLATGKNVLVATKGLKVKLTKTPF